MKTVLVSAALAGVITASATSVTAGPLRPVAQRETIGEGGNGAGSVRLASAVTSAFLLVPDAAQSPLMTVGEGGEGGKGGKERRLRRQRDRNTDYYRSPEYRTYQRYYNPPGYDRPYYQYYQQPYYDYRYYYGPGSYLDPSRGRVPSEPAGREMIPSGPYGAIPQAMPPTASAPSSPEASAPSQSAHAVETAPVPPADDAAKPTASAPPAARSIGPLTPVIRGRTPASSTDNSRAAKSQPAVQWVDPK